MTAYTSTDGIKTPDGDVLTDVLGGIVEDWHYVGDPGEPAFEDGSEAAATPLGALGGLRFYRHAGRVYIAGTAAISPPGFLFILPEGYRPEFYVGEHCESISDDAGTTGEALVSIAPDGSVGVVSADQANVIVRVDFRAA